MLIASERHAPVDLALWAEYESADLANARRLGPKVDAALDAIRAFLSLGPCFVGVSGGKDSSVTAQLVRRIDADVPLIYIRAVPHGNPDTPKVLEAIGNVEVIDADYSGIDARALGPWGVEAEKDRIFFGVCDQLVRTHGRRVLGIRAAESRKRSLRIGRYGLATAHSLAPIGRWSTADVFAYAAAFGVPLHPAYAMLGGGRWGRDVIRVDELGGERGDGKGRYQWEFEYYGDIINRFMVR